MPAATFIAAATTHAVTPTGAPGSVAISLPAGTAAGDLVILVARIAQGVSGPPIWAVPPAGWSLVDAAQVVNDQVGNPQGFVHTWSRVLDGTEGSTVAVSWTNSPTTAGTVRANAVAYRNAAIQTSTWTMAQASLATIANTTATTQGTNTTAVYFYGISTGSSADLSLDAALTQRAVQELNANGSNVNTIVGDEVYPTAATTTTARTMTSTVAAGARWARMVLVAAVTPVAVGGTIAPAGTLAKQIIRTVDGSVTPSGTLTKQVNRTVTGAVAPSGALTAQKVSTKAMAGTVTPSGTLIAVRVPAPLNPHRWQLDHPIDGSQYLFDISPAQGGEPTFEKQFGYEINAGPGETTLLFETGDSVNQKTITGTLLRQEQHDALVAWFEKESWLLLTDDLSRTFSVMLTDLTLERQHSATYPWRHQYTIGYLIISDL